MADIVKPDAAKAVIEERKRSQDELRIAYLTSLKNSAKFQKMVIQPMIAELEKITDVRNFPAGDFEEMGKLVYTNKIAVKIVERLLKDIRQ